VDRHCDQCRGRCGFGVVLIRHLRRRTTRGFGRLRRRQVELQMIQMKKCMVQTGPPGKVERSWIMQLRSAGDNGVHNQVM
jgi:hypothetical protein